MTICGREPIASPEPRRCIFAILCGALLASLAIFYGTQAWQSSKYPHNPEKQSASADAKTSSPGKTPPESGDEKLADYTWWLSAFTLFIGVVGIGQFFFLMRADGTARTAADAARDTAKATDDAVTLARKSSEIQLRAYLTVKRATVKNVVMGQYPEIFVEIINVGQTPAYNVCNTMRYFLTSFPLAPTITQPDKQTRTTVGPGLSIYTMIKATMPLSDDHIRGLHNGELAIYAVGEVTYEDAFREKRFTRYRSYGGGPRGFPPDDAMFIDVEGNEAN
jgi:hypothetical protein